MMKKQLLVLVAMLFGVTAFAQTAPDFTAMDCNGNSHTLYSELDAGKVIVLNWVMPCGACVNASVSAYNVVQSLSNPNVLYYLIDDAANTSCTALSSWATSSGIGTNRTTLSTAAIVESNYGGVGMPHIAVVGTSNHTIYFNGLNTAANNPTAIQNAITTALAAVGINEPANSSFHLSVFHSAQTVNVTYSLSASDKVGIEIVNSVGELVNKKELGKQAVGEHATEFDINNMASGIYFVRFSAGNKSETVKFTVTQ